MADQINAQHSDRATRPATQNAVSHAWRKYEAAIKAFRAFPAEITEKGLGFDEFHALAVPALLSDAPTAAQIDGVIKYAERVIKAGEEYRLAADQAEFEADQAKQAENLDRLATVINRTITWLEKQQKMEGAEELREELLTLSFELAEGKVEVQEGWKAFKAVDAQVQAHQTETIVWLVGKINRGWLLGNDGQTGRHATAYRTLGLPAKVEAWLATKPADGADFKALKAFRDAGWKLKEQIEHPWGTCSGSTCGGKGALTPNRDGKKIQPKCGKCFHASKKSGDSVREPRLDAMAELSQGYEKDPEAFAGITFNSLAPLSAETFEAPTEEVQGKKGKKGGKRQPTRKEREDLEAE